MAINGLSMSYFSAKLLLAEEGLSLMLKSCSFFFSCTSMVFWAFIMRLFLN